MIFFNNFSVKHTPCEPLKEALIITAHWFRKKHFKSHYGNIVSSSKRNDTLTGKCPFQDTANLASEDEPDHVGNQPPTPIVSRRR